MPAASSNPPSPSSSSSADYFRLPPAPPAASREGATALAQVLLFVVAALLVISRRPDAIITPQFFAEDGTVWFADAYRLGFWHTLLLPDAGYLQTFPRLIAGLATFVPLLYAPVLMTLVGIVIQVLPVNLLASARLSTLGTLQFRLLLALVYIALPNSRELDVVITNAQWHLALIACLLIVASPPRRLIGRVLDLVLLALSGLTGPFCILLLPFSALLYRVRRSRWLLVTSAVLLACALPQLYVMQHADSAVRNKAPLGATLPLFVHIFSGRVVLSAIFGGGNYAAHLSLALLILVAIGAIGVIAYALIKAKWEFRILVLFSLVVFAASLASPLVSRTEPQWPVLDQASGIRYWFFPMLAFFWSLFCIAKSSAQKMIRAAAIGVLILSVAGMARDWSYPSFPDQHFSEYVRKFEALPPGEMMAFPLYPAGWTMQLVKTSRSCSEMPVGLIDVPAENAKVAGTLQATGWVTATLPVTVVQIYVDGKAVATTRPDISRADVDATHPASAVPNKGWSIPLDTSQWGTGRHTIQARAELSNGCRAVLAAHRIEVTAAVPSQRAR